MASQSVRYACLSPGLHDHAHYERLISILENMEKENIKSASSVAVPIQVPFFLEQSDIRLSEDGYAFPMAAVIQKIASNEKMMKWCRDTCSKAAYTNKIRNKLSVPEMKDAVWQIQTLFSSSARLLCCTIPVEKRWRTKLMKKDNQRDDQQ